MGKTRDLFKKIGDIKGTFHARMGMIKDRNSKDLTEAEKIEKQCSHRPQQNISSIHRRDGSLNRRCNQQNLVVGVATVGKLID